MEQGFKTEKGIPYYEDTQKRSIGQKLKKIKNTLLGNMAYSCPIKKLRILFHRWRGVYIGKNVYIGIHCFFDNLYPEYIYILDNASVNADCMILAHFNPMKRFSQILSARVAPVIINEGAIIAVRSTILPGVKIGKNAIVSAGSVVEKDVPDYTLVKGNPAKIITEFKYLME
ncbi:MAG TPA: acyltransferase [Paludibacteraceae bacterium]|nr:acyltransferase [Paludibacteraceae bacterium]HRR62556.1 acyltransferase [Paludibacteraceae bacterium]HRU63665.1 acyltransferase [Paludibacteraceae bacterium]